MEEIGLQDLIYQIKRELLAPNPAQRAKDPDPLFFIEKVELEIAVKVQKERGGGFKVSVLSYGEFNASASTASERGHVVRVTLAPLLSKDSLLTDLLADPHVAARVGVKQRALLKGDVPLTGTPE